MKTTMAKWRHGVSLASVAGDGLCQREVNLSTPLTKLRTLQEGDVSTAGPKLKKSALGLSPNRSHVAWHAECLIEQAKGIWMVKLRVNGIDRAFDGDPDMPYCGTCATCWD